MDELSNILNELYNGTININEKFPCSEEYKDSLEECNKILKKIESKLDVNQKELFNKYIEIKSQMVSTECKEMFIEGYKLATKLIISGIK